LTVRVERERNPQPDVSDVSEHAVQRAGYLRKIERIDE
jgi:hypothetical protein